MPVFHTVAIIDRNPAGNALQNAGHHMTASKPTSPNRRSNSDSTEVNRAVLLTLLALPKEYVHEKAPKPEKRHRR
jgi:hypothetical protein